MPPRRRSLFLGLPGILAHCAAAHGRVEIHGCPPAVRGLIALGRWPSPVVSARAKTLFAIDGFGR